MKKYINNDIIIKFVYDNYHIFIIGMIIVGFITGMVLIIEKGPSCGCKKKVERYHCPFCSKNGVKVYHNDENTSIPEYPKKWN